MKRILSISLIWMVAGISLLEAQTRYDQLTYPELNAYQVPDIVTFEENGIQFFLVEDNELPLINMNVIVRAGSYMNPNEKAGLESLTAQVMRNGGTETYPDEQLNELLENRAARMELGMGLSSGSASMNVLKEDFDDLLPVFIDLLKNPAFPEDKIDLAKTQARSGISRRNDDAQSVARREFRRLIYGEGSLYGRLTEYETLNNITREDMIEFHNQAFTGSNLMIGITGDFSTRQMRRALRRAFADFPKGSENEIDLPQVNYTFDSSINFIDKPDVNQSVIFMGHVGGLRDNPDYAALQAMNEILSGGFSGRLFQIVRSEMGLAYGVFGSYQSNIRYEGQFYAGISTRSSATGDAINAVRDQIIRLQNEKVGDQELEETKERILNSLVFRYDSKSRVLRERMSYEYNGLPADAFDQYIAQLREVTAEDIYRVANEYVQPNNMRILVVGNASEIGDQLEQFGEVNEIDITIPRAPRAEAEVVSGDPELGREWLVKMADAVISPGTSVGEVQMEGTFIQMVEQAPDGKMSMKTSISMLPPDGWVQSFETPMGAQTIELLDGKGTMRAGPNEQPLPPQMVEAFKSELKRHYINLALNKDELNVEYLGSKQANGIEAAHLRFGGDLDLSLFLNKETSLPVMMRYSQFDPQSGEDKMVEEHYSDWMENAGVSIALIRQSFSDGEKAGELLLETYFIK